MTARQTPILPKAGEGWNLTCVEVELWRDESSTYQIYFETPDMLGRFSYKVWKVTPEADAADQTPVIRVIQVDLDFTPAKVDAHVVLEIPKDAFRNIRFYGWRTAFHSPDARHFAYSIPGTGG